MSQVTKCHAFILIQASGIGESGAEDYAWRSYLQASATLTDAYSPIHPQNDPNPHATQSSYSCDILHLTVVQ